jgi:hypothetical protein
VQINVCYCAISMCLMPYFPGKNMTIFPKYDEWYSGDPDGKETMANGIIDISEISYKESVSYYKRLESLGRRSGISTALPQ